MIREKIDASRERQILTLAISNTEFLKAIHPICKLELFKSGYARTVYSWISAYFKEYGVAPQKDIQELYIAHKLGIDEDEEVIATFLQSLSDEEEEPNNIPFRVKEAEEWLGLRAIELLTDSLKDCLLRKDRARADEAIANYSRVTRVESDDTDVLRDAESAFAAFTDENEVLFQFPGPLGAVMGQFKRTDFVSFLAPMKGKKSWMLLESAQQALFSGCKVLFISLEMPKNQMLRRIWTALTKRPRGPKVVRVPYFVEMDESRDDKPMYKVEYEDKAAEGAELTQEFFADWVKKFKKYFKGGDIKLKCIPAKTATVQDLATYLDNLEYYENWIPDVVVLDYADLMTSKVKGEERHKLDDIWSNLRRIALQREICIITASQANRAGIHEDLDMEHAAEDIRKVAHVTKMLGINATKEEKANGLFRISQIAERDDEAIFEQAYVTSCLSLGTVFLDSRYKSEVWVDKSKKE
jgi:hypothetical protein